VESDLDIPEFPTKSEETRTPDEIAQSYGYSSADAKVCGRCFEEVPELFAPLCKEKPEELLGAPLGMYHCPDCGTMVVAGVPHPTVCARCRDLEHPSYDQPVAAK
jgi:hypothetical protein